MNNLKGKMTNYLLNFRGYVTEHSPEILTGLGITGMISSTVLAVKATPKAMELIEERRREVNTCFRDDDISVKEKIMVAWKPYLPSIIIGIGSSICLIGACSLNNRRKAALATAYAISERAFSSYKDEVIQTIGEKKEKSIRDKVAQKDIENNPVNDGNVIITSKGETLCRDSISGRYFKSDLDDIRKIINEINRDMTYNNYISLNEYYSRLGLEPIKDGDYIGWNIEKGLLELDFDACIAQNDQPCIVIDYNITPFAGFDR